MESVQKQYTVLCIVGARPNFMKIAPIMRAMASSSVISPVLLHTGQHYDAEMKHSFFDQLHIPEPDIDLEVGSGSHAEQTAEIMKRFEPVLDELKPAAILVVGDVNSTIACALVAVKKSIAVVHVEAGLRSGDRAMPEEINRVLTDQISDLLFTTEADAIENLTAEGIPPERVHFVGNVMIDTLLYNRERATPAEQVLKSISDEVSSGYGLLTLHRPSNVDDPAVLKRLLEVLVKLSKRLPLVFPVHPRTRQRITNMGFDSLLENSAISLLPPLGYLQMLGLMSDATVVLTDSGGIQEETTALGVPCITLRENTERPITLTQGTNVLAGTDVAAIESAFNDVLEHGGRKGNVPELWDGNAAVRITQIIEAFLEERVVGHN
ncbi:non-hydrolyzing UDP-N-acetylglucosamine 2-epimerase [Neptunomonas phycophila]|uniref:non-hydrolyzing UDP-N-acetylglucosamine 2-epimerase n=1 Tax=Neptunomonas phycophila TaxID=1572645 RepID=UPI001BE89CDA|nr:UDP-N-acetylglucosamine 2-epimerase (non-hydrolyzing) [Neptunomonas phycophila]MBT3144270.1 UDP-N-acetylglucosamine 2-epimerase (non-hydrolyzing) [Neptunomonas phycophila]